MGNDAEYIMELLTKIRHASNETFCTYSYTINNFSDDNIKEVYDFYFALEGHGHLYFDNVEDVIEYMEGFLEEADEYGGVSSDTITVNGIKYIRKEGD